MHISRRLCVLLFALMLACSLTSTTHLVTVTGPSMLPALHDGDRLFISNLGKPNAGDIVVFKYQDEIYVKRVHQVLAGGAYSVLGDNRAYSVDSRDFGPIWSYQIIGRVVFRVR